MLKSANLVVTDTTRSEPKILAGDARSKLSAMLKESISAGLSKAMPWVGRAAKKPSPGTFVTKSKKFPELSTMKRRPVTKPDPKMVQPPRRKKIQNLSTE